MGGSPKMAQFRLVNGHKIEIIHPDPMNCFRANPSHLRNPSSGKLVTEAGWMTEQHPKLSMLATH